MTAIAVPDALAAGYHGSGAVLAAIKDDDLRDFVYLNDVLPDFDPADIRAAIEDLRLAPTISHLARLGDVIVGMASCWQITEI